MGTTLTGTTPQDTYDALIKVGDNGIITGSLKTLSDGEGHDTALALSTGAASVTGTLAVSGNAAFDTNTLFVDAANNRVGVGTAVPTANLEVSRATQQTDVGAASQVIGLLNTSADIANNATGIRFRQDNGTNNCNAFVGTLSTGSSANRSSLVFAPSNSSGDATEAMRITSAGNVGIGTSAPTTKLVVNSTGGDPIFQVLRDNGTNGALSLSFPSQQATFSSAVSDMVFQTVGVERARLTANGLTFNGDTAAANALFDYEEGTFTATLAPSTSGTITLSVNTCTYTKIGRQVTVKGFLTISSVSLPVGASFDINGLPFTIINSTAGRGTFSFVVLDASAGYTAFTGPTQHTANSTTIIAFFDTSTLAASDEIMFTATYFV